MATSGEVRSSRDERVGERHALPRRRRRRWPLVLASAAVVLFLTWIVGGYFVLARPHVDPVRKTDAIVVLGPADQDQRWLTGLRLAKQGYAGTLVISMNAYQRQHGFASLCESQRPFRVICFTPDPATTRGEAQETARLAARYKWKSVTVVTSNYHVTRARMIFERCNSVEVLMRPSSGHISVAKYAYQYLYQTVAFAKMLVTSRC